MAGLERWRTKIWSFSGVDKPSSVLPLFDTHLLHVGVGFGVTRPGTEYGILRVEVVPITCRNWAGDHLGTSLCGGGSPILCAAAPQDCLSLHAVSIIEDRVPKSVLFTRLPLRVDCDPKGGMISHKPHFGRVDSVLAVVASIDQIRYPPRSQLQNCHTSEYIGILLPFALLLPKTYSRCISLGAWAIPWGRLH